MENVFGQTPKLRLSRVSLFLYLCLYRRSWLLWFFMLFTPLNLLSVYFCVKNVNNWLIGYQKLLFCVRILTPSIVSSLHIWNASVDVSLRFFRWLSKKKLNHKRCLSLQSQFDLIISQLQINKHLKQNRYIFADSRVYIWCEAI